MQNTNVNVAKTGFKVDRKLNFILPMYINEKSYQLVLQQPSKIMLDSLIPLFKILFSEVINGTHIDIIKTDYEYYLKQTDIDIHQVKAFIAKLIITAEVIDMETFELLPFETLGLYRFNNNELEFNPNYESEITGSLLFLSALLRYGRNTIQKECPPFYTSLTASELVLSYKNQSNDTKTEDSQKGDLKA